MFLNYFSYNFEKDVKLNKNEYYAEPNITLFNKGDIKYFYLSMLYKVQVA
jgi:hypothetical protein